MDLIKIIEKVKEQVVVPVVPGWSEKDLDSFIDFIIKLTLKEIEEYKNGFKNNA